MAPGRFHERAPDEDHPQGPLEAHQVQPFFSAILPSVFTAHEPLSCRSPRPLKSSGPEPPNVLETWPSLSMPMPTPSAVPSLTELFVLKQSRSISNPIVAETGPTFLVSSA